MDCSLSVHSSTQHCAAKRIRNACHILTRRLFSSLYRCLDYQQIGFIGGRAEILEPRMLLSSISGTVFQDLDADGVLDAGEPGHAGVTVYLDANQNGQLDAGEVAQTTDSSGAYTFSNLPTGVYAVAEVVPSYWVQTTQKIPTDLMIQRVSVDSAGVQANGHSIAEQLSADGRYVLYDSYASNLVPGDTNEFVDVFVFDRTTRTTERVNVDSSGVQANGSSSAASISADGRYVLYDPSSTVLFWNFRQRNELRDLRLAVARRC